MCPWVNLQLRLTASPLLQIITTTAGHLWTVQWQNVLWTTTTTSTTGWTRWRWTRWTNTTSWREPRANLATPSTRLPTSSAWWQPARSAPPSQSPEFVSWHQISVYYTWTASADNRVLLFFSFFSLLPRSIYAYNVMHSFIHIPM